MECALTGGVVGTVRRINKENNITDRGSAAKRKVIGGECNEQTECYIKQQSCGISYG